MHTPIEYTKAKNPPKHFQKEASSPSRQGIERQIKRYYCSEKLLVPVDTTPGLFKVTNKDGKALSCHVIQTMRGFYFGFFRA